LIFLKSFQKKVFLLSLDRTSKLKPIGRFGKFEVGAPSRFREIKFWNFKTCYYDCDVIWRHKSKLIIYYGSWWFGLWYLLFFILNFQRFHDLSRKINFWVIANFRYSRSWTTDIYLSKDAEFCKEAGYIAKKCILSSISRFIAKKQNSLLLLHYNGQPAYLRSHDSWVSRLCLPLIQIRRI